MQDPKDKNNFDFIKTRNSCSVKHSAKRMKTQATDRQKILGNHLYDKALVSKTSKGLLKLNKKKTT